MDGTISWPLGSPDWRERRKRADHHLFSSYQGCCVTSCSHSSPDGMGGWDKMRKTLREERERVEALQDDVLL